MKRKGVKPRSPSAVLNERTPAVSMQARKGDELQITLQEHLDEPPVATCRLVIGGGVDNFLTLNMTQGATLMPTWPYWLTIERITHGGKEG
jgi:hypothetical protein